MRTSKSFIFLLFLLTLSTLMSCFRDGVDVPDEPLAGKIGGQDWSYALSSNFFYGNGKYTFLFLSDEENSSESCSVVNSTNPHIRVVLPYSVGSYSLPLPQPIENLKFVLGNGSELQATSGFIEVLAVDGLRMSAYISAQVDDNNFVEGRIIVRLC